MLKSASGHSKHVEVAIDDITIWLKTEREGVYVLSAIGVGARQCFDVYLGYLTIL